MIVLLPRSGLCFAVARRFYKSTEPGVSVQSQFQGNFPRPIPVIGDMRRNPEQAGPGTGSECPGQPGSHHAGIRNEDSRRPPGFSRCRERGACNTKAPER